MNPGPCVFVTVTFTETAAALAGLPQRPVSVKFRGDPWVRAGGPYAPVKPLPRVSAMRQGGRSSTLVELDQGREFLAGRKGTTRPDRFFGSDSSALKISSGR